MAKPLGLKSQLIRQAISDNPKMGNKEIAEMLMDASERMDDKIKVTPQDIAQQKQQMKKADDAKPKRGRPAAVPVMPAATPHPAAVPAAPHPAAQGSPVDVIDGVFNLAQQCGGIEQLKRLVDRLASR